MVVGAPGILLAIVVRMTLAEPVRGIVDNRVASDAGVPFRDALAFLWSRRSFRHMATTHSLLGLRMRALSSAILFLILNLVGLDMGPLFVGLLSDYLQVSHGSDSLRLAMLYLLPIAVLWSSVHCYLAGKTLRADLAAAPD